MSTKDLEQALRNLPRIGKLIKDRGDRQTWRFEHNEKPFYLHFFPRSASRFRRLFLGNPAMREFVRLQWLQKASIPSPRAVAVLSGFWIDTQLGDAIIIEGIEPSQPLDVYLNNLELSAQPVPNHLKIAEQVRTLVHNLALAKMSHDDLHLGCFLIGDGRVYLKDATHVRRGAIAMNDIMRLAHSASRFATKQDLRRGWDLLAAGPVPKKNPLSNRLYRKFTRQIRGENEYFGRMNDAEWRAVFFKHSKYPRRWSRVSGENFTLEDWRAAWPQLLAQVESDQFSIIKRDRSGDVLEGEIVLGGRPIQVIVKRPRVKYWYRYLTALGRPSRALRTWIKAWKMIARNVPVDWPMLVIEKRILGYVVDSLLVVERLPGKTLAAVDLDAFDTNDRETLFRRVGRILRKIDTMGFGHFDAKATNWIVVNDDKLGPTPVMIDADGVRHYPHPGAGIDRVLRSMRQHPQYTPSDSLALCLGFSPFGRLGREPVEEETQEAKAPEAT